MGFAEEKRINIVLLRGLGRESAHWGDFPSALKSALDTYFRATVECIDLMGTGEFYQQAASSNLSDLTDHARLETKTRFDNISFENDALYLIGISMGAMVALDWAQRDSNIKGVVLINSSLGQHPLFWRLRLPVWPKALLALLAPMQWRERIMLNIVSNKTHGKSNDLRHWQDIQKRHPVTRRNIIAMLLAAAHFKPSSFCHGSGLIVASKRDRLVSYQCSHAIAKRFQWPLLEHPTAGHDLPLDDGTWLIERICEWILSENAASP